ncbi:FLYWCH-type domain-containing protein [Meloidogyne graminicola]|uniref:FLYWCH-type domain-containing protein n=1 Tax=Meloidogyne graminicola TaxID=189291 RepID=A0A8S9ZKA5_9BILA|nr:FLYWCH-type domain-containing protein [Meloidogyne graminicola]
MCCISFFNCFRKTKKEDEQANKAIKSTGPKSPQQKKLLKGSENKKKSLPKLPLKIEKRSKSPNKDDKKKPKDTRKKRKKLEAININKPVDTAKTITYKASTPTSDSLLLSKKVSEAHLEHFSSKEVKK